MKSYLRAPKVRDRYCFPTYVREIFDRFCESLVLDGFVVSSDYRLLPHTPEPASLGPKLSKLENNLKSCGLNVSFKHYQQAFENFTDGILKLVMGQSGLLLQNLIPEICKQITGGDFTCNPPSALQHLKQKSKIDGSEEGMFKNFWTHIQDEGPHQGLTTQSESLYRLHMATAIGRYLMEKLLHVT